MTLKRKFQFDSEWSATKTSLWLKSYPKLMLQLYTIRTMITKNETVCEKLCMLYQRSRWIGINANLHSCLQNKKADIANVYVAQHATKELINMKQELIDIESNIHKCYISLKMTTNNNNNNNNITRRELGDLQACFSKCNSALSEIHFYLEKIIVIIKNWTMDINKAFHVQFCKKLPLFQLDTNTNLNEDLKQIHTQKDFEKVKIDLQYDFYKQFPKEFLLSDTLPVPNFCKYLSFETMQSQTYWNELFVNTNLVFAYNSPNMFFKSEKFQLCSYNSDMQIIICRLENGTLIEFRLLKPFSVYNALTRENLLSYNFESKSKDVLCIQKFIDFHFLKDWLAIDLVKIVSSYIMDEYVTFYEPHEIQTQFYA